MRDLSAEGLIETAGDRRLTERGRNALKANAYTVATEERRVFTFAEGEGADRPLAFVALHGLAAPLAPGAGWRFDVAALETCIRRPEEWKTRNGFPTDVDALLAPSADWRRMILDRPEQILLVFVTEDGPDARRLGFAVRPEDWVLQTQAPALMLGAGAEETLSDADEPAPEAWREAWREWCRQRGLPDADACGIEPAEDRVRVVAPGR